MNLHYFKYITKIYGSILNKNDCSQISFDNQQVNISNLTQPKKNPSWHGYECIQCEVVHPLGDYPNGCPHCALREQPANLFCIYNSVNSDIDLPYGNTLDLGQGKTPLVPMPDDSGGGFFKLELANPTGSHKDRMAAMGVAHAKATGKRAVIAASSGNAGVAIAAYAAAYGLECEIAVTPGCSALFRNLIIAHGATVTQCESSLARWEYLARRVADPAFYAMTNFALPAVGSPAVAIEGYKPIALELIEQCANRTIAAVYVPTARGDLLWGLYLGFEQLRIKKKIQRLPRLIAVEPFERLTKVMVGHDYRSSFSGVTQQLSTSGSTATLQAVSAMKKTGGYAIVVPDDKALAARHNLARHGFLFELCAAATWHAYQHDENRLMLAENPHSDANACSIVMATAHGSRDVLN